MKEGTIKKFFEDKNFGFISVEGEEDAFCHLSGCVEGYQPQEGDNVTFIIGQNERTGKDQAQEVQLAEAAE